VGAGLVPVLGDHKGSPYDAARTKAVARTTAFVVRVFSQKP
jgi:hypothetical protein